MYFVKGLALQMFTGQDTRRLLYFNRELFYKKNTQKTLQRRCEIKIILNYHMDCTSETQGIPVIVVGEIFAVSL